MQQSRFASVKTLVSSLKIDEDTAKKIRGIIKGDIRTTSIPETATWVDSCYHRPDWSERAMHAIDVLLKNHGVESTCLADDQSLDSDDYVSYSNTGDTYEPTICYFRGRFLLTSWGDLVEKYDRS